MQTKRSSQNREHDAEHATQHREESGKLCLHEDRFDEWRARANSTSDTARALTHSQITTN
jgi:hypothetical protein